MSETERRQRLVDVCTGPPEVVAEGEGHIRFAVRGKPFAYYLEDHHGDGRIAVCCKAPPGDQEALVATDPERFYLPAYLARYGWISLRLDRPALDWEEVSELVVDSYRLVAPKRLAAVAAEATQA
jgi:predicted DNA-binding protein (MmcQ/YjbR family)